MLVTPPIACSASTHTNRNTTNTHTHTRLSPRYTYTRSHFLIRSNSGASVAPTRLPCSPVGSDPRPSTMQHRSRSPIGHRTPEDGPTVGPSAAPIGSREWAAHGARQALRRIREESCPVAPVAAVGEPVAPVASRRPSTMLALMADGPVGEPVAPVAAAYTSEDTGARRRGVHLVGQCVDTLVIHVDYEDPEEAEEGFYYDVAAARGAPGQSPPPPPPARGRPSREEYLARNPLSPPRSRAERWHASGGTVGRPSPAAPGPAYPLSPPRSRSERWRASGGTTGAESPVFEM